MAYTANVPLANQQIAASQSVLQANFVAILAAFNANHTNLSTGTGLHKYVQFSTQSSAPTFTQPGFWAKNTGTNPIMLHAANGDDRNISDTVVVAAGTAFYLPCGLLLKYGTATTDATNNVYIDLDGIGDAYAATPIAYATGKHTATPAYNFVLAAIATNAAGYSTTRYLRVSTHNDATGTGLPNAPFNWFTIGTV